MSIKTLPDSPLFTQMFTKKDLETYVASLNALEVSNLQREVYFRALAEGITIADWDRDWGKYHLFDSTARLVHIVFEKKRVGLFNAIGQRCPSEKTDLIVNHCPLFLENLLSTKADAELHKRADIIAQLSDLNTQLCIKYHQLFSSDDSNSIKSAWKGIETYYLTLPSSLNSKDIEQFKYLTSVIEEILNGNYDEITVQIILERLMRKESFHPTSTDLSNYFRVKSIHKMTMDQVHNRSLQTAGESLWKSIHIIPSSENKQGKFKPLNIHSAIREVYTSQCDRLCGLEMTAPTGLFSIKNIFESIYEIKKLFEASSIMSKRNNLEEAASLRQHAFDLFKGSHIPKEVRNSIFGEMYNLSGNNWQIDDLGEKLFYNADGLVTSDHEKTIAIQNYLKSDAFNQHAIAFNVQGSVQPWIQHCARAYDLIVKDPAGGEKLKTAPKTLVHFYALLGILKGSMDCSSGNTIVDYRPELNRVVNFWDFDDERSIPTTDNFQEFRMWQMGLPQSAQPFDRAVLLMFLDPRLKEKFIKQQTSLQISKAAYGAQLKRLEKLREIFEEELGKAQITLTPRELFFKMFGGQEEFHSIKSYFNNDKTYSEEGIRISPIEIFEFHLANMGNGCWYTSDENKKTLISRNMKALYYPDLP